MKKIIKLPINPDPYIRLYTHHGYLHAISGTTEKVLDDIKEPAAVVTVKDYDQYQWHYDNKSIFCKPASNNGLAFFCNNIWNLDMNMTIWRECKAEDEICITVEKYIKSCPYASVHIFVTERSEGENIGTDYLHNFEFGVFAKDGIYFNNFSDTHEVLNSNITLPAMFFLKKSSEGISIYYEEAKGGKSDQIVLPVESDRCKVIGFSIDLRCGTYYEWLFSNYINIHVNLENQMPIDYLCLINKDYGYYTTNYFIDYTFAVENRDWDSIKYIQRMIDEGKYVEVMINDMIHEKQPTYTFFHQDLIYGYNDINACFYVLYYVQGKVKQAELKYEDYLSERNRYKDAKMHIYTYCPGYEGYNFSINHILQVFKEYKDSKNISYYECADTDKNIFGIDAIRAFLTEKGREILLDDIRVTYCFHERSKCNHDRIRYMFSKGLISDYEYRELSEKAIKIMKLTEKLMFMVVKLLRFKSGNDECIVQYLQDYINLEYEFTDKIINVLEQHLL